MALASEGGKEMTVEAEANNTSSAGEVPSPYTFTRCEKPYNMRDIVFILVSKFDSIDRLENTLIVSNFLSESFDTNVLVWEIGEINNGIFQRLKSDNVQYDFHEDNDPILHRTKYINAMVESVNEPYVAVWDVDVLAPKEQIRSAVNLLRKGADFVYPYKDFFFDTSREIRKLFFQTGDIRILLNHTDFMTELYAPKPVGGAFFANRKIYIESGMEETKFYGWGIEDGERIMRWRAQERIIERVDGPLFHLSHGRGLNSTIPTKESQIFKKRVYFESCLKKL